MKVALTGNAGFIGSHLTDKLIELGHTVVGIDNLITGKKENINPSVIFYEEDICSESINKIISTEKPDVIYHLAAHINLRESLKDPIGDANVNIMGSLNLIQAAKENNVKKFIFTSTGGAMYGETLPPWNEDCSPRPKSPYALSKLTIEKYLDILDVNYIIYRLANVYGPRQSAEGAGVISIFIDKLLNREEPIIFGTGNQKRDFIYIEDVVNALLLPITRNLSKDNYNVFNVGTGVGTSVLELYKEIKKHFDLDIDPLFIDPIKDELYESVLISNRLDYSSKIKLSEGIEKTIKWFKEKYENIN